MRLVYLSPVPLASFAQRPHHFVHWFHERFDAPVTWIEPYPARLPRAADLRRLRRPAGPTLGPDWRDAPWIRALRPRALPFEPLAAGRWLNRLLWSGLLDGLDGMGGFHAPDDEQTWIVAGKPCALAIELFRRHPRALKVFDVMDNVPAFASGRSRRWLERAEAELAAGCDRLLVSATPLAQRFPVHAGKLLCVRNGLTPPARPPRSVPATPGSWTEPQDKAAPGTAGVGSAESAAPQAGAHGGLPTGPTVFGYLGAIASWFDWDAVIALALRFPQSVVRLIGPCEHRPARLPPNVELLPGIPQDRVYDALAGFTFGLIPFRIDPLTECVDPVKYYEYRAMGLPVLSTRFGEMRLRGAQDRVAFLDELDRLDLQALARQAADPAEVQAFREENTWARRFEPLSAWARASAGR